MTNIAALGLYMLLTTIAGDPNAVTKPVMDNSNLVLVERKVEAKDVETDVNTEAQVRAYFKDIPILADVARCESEFRQTDKNGNIIRGTKDHNDVGVMQINERYHLEKSKELGMDIYTLEGNMEYARLLYQEEGTGPWMASSGCWSGKLTTKTDPTVPQTISNS